MKTCSKCKKRRRHSNFRKNSRARDGLSSHCKPCASAYNKGPEGARKLAERQKRYMARKRDEALEKLGGVCCHCGFSDKRALQIDHVDGGGGEECRRIGRYGILVRVLRGEPGYQLLCANCNWIKRVEAGEVPATYW